MKKLTIAPEHHSAVASAAVSFLNFLPVDVLLSAAFSVALSTIKNPTSKAAKAIQQVVVNFVRTVQSQRPEWFV